MQEAHGHIDGDPAEMQLTIHEFLPGIERLEQFKAEQLIALGRDLSDLPEILGHNGAESGGIEPGVGLEKGRLAAGNIADEAIVQLNGTQSADICPNFRFSHRAFLLSAGISTHYHYSIIRGKCQLEMCGLPGKVTLGRESKQLRRAPRRMSVH